MSAPDDAVGDREELLQVEGQLEVGARAFEEGGSAEHVKFDVGAAVRVVLVVAGVVDDAALELKVLSAEGLVLGDDSEVNVGLVEGGEAVVDAGGVLGVARTEVVVGDAAGPAEGTVVSADLALQAAHDAENVALHQVPAHSGIVGELGAVDVDGPVEGAVERGCAVEAVETVGLVAEIGDGAGHAEARDEVRAVKRSVVDGVALAVPGCLEVHLVEVVGIEGAVAVVVDVGEGAVVPAEVG